MQLTVKQIFDMIDNGQLHYDQTTQREFIYNDEKITTDDGEMTRAGAVIRAILKLDIQLPAVYFWQNEDGSYNIHDGKQRILSLYSAFFPNKTGNPISTNLGYGALACPNSLNESDKNKILNYIFEVVVKKGSKELEETSFYEINTHSVNLTQYECLKGMFYGNFITTFEKYIISSTQKYNFLKKIGRGEQALEILKVILLRYKDFENPNIFNLLKLEIKKNRNNTFEPDLYNLNEIFELVSQFDNLFNGFKISKMLLVSKYIVEKNKSVQTNWDFNKIMNAFKKISKQNNDVQKWELGTFQKFIEEAVLNNNILDGRRFFNDDKLKSDLFIKQQHCCYPGCPENNFKKLELDHIIPWSKGGRTDESNAQLMCKSHNSSKKDQFIED